MSKIRKQTKSNVTSHLDKICSQIVRSRGYCERCGPGIYKEYSELQCAHSFSRTYRNTRWLLLNLTCLCASCHFWAHRNPILFTEWLKEHLGDHKYIELKNTALAIKRWTVQEMLELHDSLSNLFTRTKEGV